MKVSDLQKLVFSSLSLSEKLDLKNTVRPLPILNIVQVQSKCKSKAQFSRKFDIEIKYPGYAVVRTKIIFFCFVCLLCGGDDNWTKNGVHDLKHLSEKIKKHENSAKHRFNVVFFVLRKKTLHISFLHVYHHFGMCCLGWIGTKYVPGGHSYFLGLANSIVHALLYSYYLLTAYDSKYSRLLWLKKCITQAQLIQFAFILLMFGQLPFRPECQFPKIITFFLIPQNFFMIILFGDFYIRTYHLAPRKKRQEQERKRQELEKERKDSQERKES